MRYSDKQKQEAVALARTGHFFAASIKTGAPVRTIRRWLAAAGVVAEPDNGQADARAFYYTVTGYPGCCGARIAYGFGWPRGRVPTAAGLRAIEQKHASYGYNLFGITNQSQEDIADILRQTGWDEQMNVGGNYSNNRLRSWVFVPKKRRISQPNEGK